MRKLKLLFALCALLTIGGSKIFAQEAGTYYIQNVGTGKWLGPGNSWGTQASVLQHADYWKLAKISDGVYTLESVVSNGGTNYYLTGTYCDGAATNFTFTAIGGKENTYSIANSQGGYLTTNGTTVDVSATDASAANAQWKLWSHDDLINVMNDTNADYIESPFDATFLIKDHDLGRNNRDYSAWSNTGATAPKTSDENLKEAMRYSIEAYHQTFDVNQTLNNVPNGLYALRVNGFGRKDSESNAPYIYANDQQGNLPNRTGSENTMQAAAVSFEAGNYLSDPVYVRVTNGTLKIGVATKGTGYWVIFKNFHLYYYGNVTIADINKHNAYVSIQQAVAGKSNVNVTSHIANLSFEDGNLNAWTSEDGGNVASNANFSGKVGKYFVERWKNGAALGNGSLTHDLIGLPKGVYTITANAQNIEQYNNNAAGTGYFLCVNDESKEIGAAGTYSVMVNLTGENNDVTLKFLLDNCTGNWVSCDDIQIIYNFEDFPELSAVEGYMNSTVAATQTQALAAYNSSKTPATYQAAVAAIEAAKASISGYAALKSYFDKAATLDADGQSSFNANETVAALKTAYDNATFEAPLTSEQVTTLDAALDAAVKAQTTVDSDWTLALKNPSFELGNTTGWTVGSSNDTGARATDNATYAMTNSEGNWLFNTWSAGLPITQTVTGLAEGFYRITVVAARDAGTVFILANDLHEPIVCTDKGTGTEGSVKIAIVDGSLTLGAVGGKGNDYVEAGGDWYKVDNFRLTFLGNAMSEEEASEIIASVPQGKKMNAEVQTALNNALAAFNSSKTISNYNALQTAIANANNSINAYTAAATAIADAKALQSAHNFASATAASTFASAIAAIEDPWTANTLTDADANNAATTLGVSVSGWRANPNGAAVKYLNDGFSLNDFDAALYVNTWSTEGATDGTNFVVPFYEYWTDDTKSLAGKTWTGTLTDLPNGLYMVNVWVRARIKNGDDVVDGETTTIAQTSGLTLDLNGGEVVDFADNNMIGDGTEPTDTRFRLAQLVVTGLVKDGTLKFNINVAADNNISWVSFKNVSYQKVRDLTQEEMAVAPTAIALEPVRLTADNNTATLTPTFTPENATTTVTWTSSDEAVATVSAAGVVTGVLPGTATITATSTIDTSVSGTCQVTVSYPESVIPETYEVTEGVTKKVYTLSQHNLFVNGSFGYPNGVYGWKATNYNTDAVASNFTITATGGVDNGAYITTNAGGAGDATSIRQSMAVEAGKTYYFATYTSGKAPASNNFQYNALFKMTNATTEDGVLKQFEWPQGANNTSSEWSKTEYVFTADEAHPFVGVRMSWNSSTKFDNFVLVEVTNVETIDLRAAAEDYAALNQALDAHVVGFLAGEYAPYNNVSAMTAYNAAKAIDQNADNLATDVQAATAALEAAEWGNANAEEVNAFFDGSFEHDYSGESGNVQPLGWYRNEGTYSGDGYNVRYVTIPSGVEGNTSGHGLFGKFTMMYGKQTGYSLPLKAGVYSISFMYGGYGETGSRIIKVFSGDTQATVLPTTTITAKNNQANTKADAYSKYEGKIVVPADGDYVFSFYRENTSSQNQIAIVDIKMFSVPESSVTLAVTAAKYGTFVAPFNVTLPEGVKAYTVQDGEQLTMTEVSDNTIPANTPVVVSSEEVVNETVKGYSLATKDSYTVESLTGTYAKIAAPNGSYILQKQGDKVGFYRVDTNAAQPNVPANRAYLTSSSNARSSFLFEDSEVVDGIGVVKALTEGEALIYDVNGVRQPRLVKGLNIIRTKDGRTTKVMVK